jgi:hypothetical protein
MDDFNLSSLTESRNEYSSLLLKKLTPLVVHGFNSMFEDTLKMCEENDEEEKYLMTFQNFLTRVPKWNKTIIDGEVSRIKEETNCSYIEDLLTCVHITHLKILTNMRVGHKQKKINIDVPSFDIFIHKVYIEVARRLYKSVYLFETDIMPIQKQRNIREFELVVNDSILDVIRSNMPIESILKAYLDESSETKIFEKVEEIEVKEEEQPKTTLKTDDSELSKLIKQEINKSNENLLQSSVPTISVEPTRTPAPTPIPTPIPTPLPLNSVTKTVNTSANSPVNTIKVDANPEKKVGFIGTSLNSYDADSDNDEDDRINISSNLLNEEIKLDIEELK